MTGTENSNEYLFKLQEYLDMLVKGRMPAALDADSFPEGLRLTAENLNKLGQNIKELSEFAVEIGRGNLAAEAPPRQNYIAGALKDLHSKMQHISWQASQVASGNFNQSLDFMGEFTDIFNSMIQKVADREQSLKEQLVRLDIERKQLAHSYDFLSHVFENLPEIILVLRQGKVLYENNKVKSLRKNFDAAGAGENILTFCAAYRSAYEKEHIDYYDEFLKRWYLLDIRRFTWRDEMDAFLIVATDVTLHKKKEMRLQRASEIDALTRTNNRKRGLQLLAQALRNKRNFPICVCFIDLDGLKQINDTFGHAAGDDFLKLFVSKFKKALEPGQYISRIGGDEFLLIMKQTTVNSAIRIVQKVEKELHAVQRDGDPCNYEFSYGLLEVDEDSTATPQELVKKADKMMYHQKKAKKLARGLN